MTEKQRTVDNLFRELKKRRTDFTDKHTRVLLTFASQVAENKLVAYSPQLTSPNETIEYFKGAYLDCTHREHFGVLFMNNRHSVITFEKSFFVGTLNGASVYPREIVKKALEVGATYVTICHNHPSGECAPSAADRAITSRIRDALQLVDVRLLDHLVISCIGVFSFAEHGLM